MLYIFDKLHRSFGKRLIYVMLTAFAGACVSGCQGSGNGGIDVPETPLTKKNIIFILADDLGYADIGAYNPDSFYKTPNIDALAANGVLFTNGYAANPVCSPTRAAIMTGKHPSRIKATEWFHINNYPHRTESFRHGVNNDFLSPDETTIAEIYKADGYNTAFLGKWHLGEDETMLPQYQGFDVNIGGAAFGFPRGGYFSPYNNPALKDGPEGEYLTDRLTSEAINLVESYSEDDNPYFLYLSFYTVHVPLEAPKPIIEKYETKKGQEPLGDDFAPEDQYFISETQGRKVRIRQNHPTYAAMIEKMDDNIGRLMAAVKASGQADNTIIVFTSDNGGLSTSEGSPTSNLPLRGGKGWLYEGGIRVPFIINAPGDAHKGVVTDQPAVSMDFIPTLAALTHTELPKGQAIDGLSLGLTASSDEAVMLRPLHWHYPHYSNQGGFPGAAIRQGDYKLLQNFEDGSLQLYNLATDIHEQDDIKDAYPEITDTLKSQLYDWYRDVDAEFLRPRLDTPDVLPWQAPLENP